MCLSLLLGMIVGGAMVQGDSERDGAIALAMSSTRAAVALAEADPERPAFHYRAPALWMNDPNGPIYWKGWYHVFYQANPFSDRSGPKYWGHARSRDLVDWEDLPIAIWPSLSKDENEIWSGSCFPAPGALGPATPTAFYTSISSKRAPEQWAASPEDDDLIRWKKVDANPVLTSDLQEWRDPFLFAHEGGTYLITGGGQNGRAIVALYKAKDDSLLHWDYQGILFRYPDADVANIECPNIAQIGDKWVLLVSVRGHVESFVGDIDKSMQFHASSRGVLDPGSYASQLLHDKHGQAIHLAWVPTDDRKGWNGFLTLPSLLSLAKDGTLLRTPIPDLHELRGQRFDLKDTAVSQELDLSSKVSGDLLEVVAHVQFKDSKGFGIKLRRSADGSRAQTLHYEATHGDLELDVFLDRGVIDEYGSVNRTTRFSARQGDLGVSLFADGGSVIVKSLEIYKLRPAKFELVGW